MKETGTGTGSVVSTLSLELGFVQPVGCGYNRRADTGVFFGRDRDGC